MASTTILGWLTSRRSARRSNAGASLLPRRHFKAALRRERLRSDRTLTCFSLLTVKFSKDVGSHKIFVRAVQVLERRVRETDLPGWFKSRTIGIILPDTLAEGAWTLAGDLRRLLAEYNIAAKFSVYVYPSFDSGDGQLLEDGVLADRGLPQLVETQPLEVLFLKKLPAWKRAMDILGAGAALVLLLPVMLMAALAVRISSPGPILFVQRRHGLGGRTFKIYKFRTMIVNADDLKAQLRSRSEQDGPAFKLKHDPRVTRIGNFLRRSSIDELPQLLNVLRGEMSLVGPRPLPCDESSACLHWQKKRLNVTPGLTCIWQVKGRSRVSFDEWMRMDLEYVRRRGILHDLRLLAQTVWVVLSRRGAY